MECSNPVFYHWTEPVARKDHQCCECYAPILKGEKHFYVYGKWDFGIESYRQHLTCMEACMLIRDKFLYECIGFGSLMEEWGNMNYQSDKQKEPWKQLRSLMAKIKWRERRGKRQQPNLGGKA